MFDQLIPDPDLRIIKTARTMETINEAARQGFRPLIKKVEPSPEIHYMVAVFQHRRTGEIELSGDCREVFGEEYEMVVPYQTYYPYQFPSPFAAYLLPKDLIEGERVWIEDVIEDIIAVFGNQCYQPRLESCEAIWKDGDFEILFDPEEDAHHWVG